MKLRELLARRSDLSTFLVHLTRSASGQSGKDRLANIIKGNQITAVSPFGHAVRKMTQIGMSTETQLCACFTETPLEHIGLLTSPIEGRRLEFEPYGLIITKKQGRQFGVNPVWYLDTSPGHSWLTNQLDSLIDSAIPNGPDDPLFRLTPFIEQFGTGKDFSWEREWRSKRSFPLPSRYIVLCPEDEHSIFRRVLASAKKNPDRVRFIDPYWGLETIIARLAGFYPHEVGPILEN